MSRSRLFSRVAAGAVATALVTAGLTAAFVTPANAGAITTVNPPFAFNNGTVTISFTASQRFNPATAEVYLYRAARADSSPISPLDAGVHPSACLSNAQCSHTQSQEEWGNIIEDANPADTTYSAEFDLTAGEFGAEERTGPANPDTYDLVIREARLITSVEDACSRCFTVLSTGAPTVTNTSHPNFRPGATLAPYTINGTNFTRGTGVEALFGGAPDPSIRFFAQDYNTDGDDPNPDTATQLTKKIVVNTNAPGGARDLRIFNTDGGSVICSRCLSIDSLLVDSVIPGATDNRGVKRIAITGSRFQPGAEVRLVRFPTLPDQPDIIGTDTAFVNNFNGTQTISATFDMTGAAPGGNSYIPRVTNVDGASGGCTCRFSVASLAPAANGVEPASREVGTDDGPESLVGVNIARGAKITFSNPGVTVAPNSTRYVSTTQTDFLVDVASNAAVGKVDVTVTNTDGQASTCPGCFEVTAAPASPEPTPSPSTSTEPPPPPAEDQGVYTPVNPARVLDTRDGTGGVRSPLGPGESRPFQVTGQGGIAAGATAVVFNLTAISPSSSGFLTAFPTGSSRPNASNVNFIRGDVVANLVKVKIGTDGKVSLFNNSGTTNVAADVVGYYAKAAGSSTPSESASPAPSESASASGSAAPSVSGSAAPSASASASASESPSASAAPTTAPPSSDSRYTGIVPVRILDTRDGNGGSNRPIGPGESRVLQVTGRAGVPANATAVVYNMTAITPTASGFLTAYPTGTTRPTASNINFRNGQVIANLVIVRIGNTGKISIYNNSGDTHAAGDVVGYFSPTTSAASYTPLQPQRILDTRDGSNSPARPIGPGESRSFRVTGLAGVPTNATAVTFNLTAVAGANAGFLTAYPAGSARPLASNVNFVRGEVRPNLVIVKVGNAGQVTLFNNSGNTHAIADIVGYFGPFDPSAPPTASPSPTPSATPSATGTPTATATPSVTPSGTPSGTPAATTTPSASATPATVPVSSSSSSNDARGQALLGLVLLVALGAAAGVGSIPASYARRH